MPAVSLLLLVPGACQAAYVLAGITAWEGARAANWTSISLDFDANGTMHCRQTMRAGGPKYENVENSAVSASALYTLEDVASDGVAVGAYNASTGRLLGARRRLKPDALSDALFFGLAFAPAAGGRLASVVLDYPAPGEAGAYWVEPTGRASLVVSGLRDLAFRANVPAPGASAFDAATTTLHQVVMPRRGAANGTLGLLSLRLAESCRADCAALVPLVPQDPAARLLSTVAQPGGAILGLYARGQGAARSITLVTVDPLSGLVDAAGQALESGDESFDPLVVLGHTAPFAGLVAAATQSGPLGAQASALYVWDLGTGARHRCPLRAPVSMLHEVR